MKAVLQRVTRGEVTVDNRILASIKQGLVILLGIEKDDDKNNADALAKKCANLRIFGDAEGKMNLSALDIGGSAIVVSQFTLLANTQKGNRPSFIDAANPKKARPLVDYFCSVLEKLGVPTQTGEFGAHMLVNIRNDGPVTIELEF